MILNKWYINSNEWFDRIPYKKRVLISLIFILISTIVIVSLGNYQWLGLLIYVTLLFNWRYWYLSKKLNKS